MEDIKCSFHNDILTILSCPNVVSKEIIDTLKDKYKNIKEIRLPEGVVKIGINAFKEFVDLDRVVLSDTIKHIGACAFANCDIRFINMPNSLETIDECAFYECRELEDLVLKENVSYIGDGAFYNSGIKRINIPSKVSKLNSNLFGECFRLSEVNLSDSLVEISDAVFAGCQMLRYIEIPESVEIIDDDAFTLSSLEKIKLPSKMKYIGKSIFDGCRILEEVTIPHGITVIEEDLFSSSAVKKVVLPDSVEVICSGAFKDCFKLKSIKLPINVKKIEELAFDDKTLEEIYLPISINKVDNLAFGCHLDKSLKMIHLFDSEDNMIDINVSYRMFEKNVDDLLYFRNKKDKKYGFVNDGKYITFNRDDIIKGELEKLHSKYYIRAWYWIKKNKFLPSLSVIKNMPIEDIDLFYINNNYKKWSELVELANISNSVNKDSFFKLCYVLGLFNKKGSVSDCAYEFIKCNVINKLDEDAIHAKFDGFDTINRYDEVFASFFMKYFKDNMDFLCNEDGVDMTIACYNNFKNIKEIYCNKKVNTNRRSEILLPHHVINALNSRKYFNVAKDNFDFSLIIGKYGYTQNQFDALQSWYEEAKKLNESDLKLFISEDSNKNFIKYELLDKDNPLGAVLGNITNCCQVVGGAGESCVKYGMTKPNSKFMTFSMNKKIVGQSWVWYNEKTKTVCLDNIELINDFLNVIKKDSKVQKDFISCLKRMASNFISEMESHDLEVKKVTIGEGFVDIKYLLDREFALEKGEILDDYTGYSDAFNQYIINKR